MASIRTNPDLDEGLSGDPRAIHLGALRAAIRVKITGPNGYYSWSMANDVGRSLTPTMAADTVINFAMGWSLRPSANTIRKMGEVAGLEFGGLPTGSEKPEGWVPFE